MTARLFRKGIFRRLSVACVVLIAGLSSLFLASLFAPAALADYQTGLNAYKAKDYATAMREWLVEAERGHPGAMKDLSYLYELGLGTPQNADKAIEWLTQAIPAFEADARNPAYMTDYRNTAANFAREIPKIIEGIRLRAQAKQQSGKAQTSNQNYSGNEAGVRAVKEKEYALAMNEFLRGFRSGEYNAGANIAYLYQHGFGVAKDPEKELEWRKKALEVVQTRMQRLEANAQSRYALNTQSRYALNIDPEYNQLRRDEGRYKEKNTKLERQLEKASATAALKERVPQLQARADQGDGDAMVELAILFIKGRGVERDLNRAKKLIFEAWKQVRSQFRSDAEIEARYSSVSADEKQAYYDFKTELMQEVRKAGSVLQALTDKMRPCGRRPRPACLLI